MYSHLLGWAFCPAPRPELTGSIPDGASVHVLACAESGQHKAVGRCPGSKSRSSCCCVALVTSLTSLCLHFPINEPQAGAGGGGALSHQAAERTQPPGLSKKPPRRPTPLGLPVWSQGRTVHLGHCRSPLELNFQSQVRGHGRRAPCRYGSGSVQAGALTLSIPLQPSWGPGRPGQGLAAGGDSAVLEAGVEPQAGPWTLGPRKAELGEPSGPVGARARTHTHLKPPKFPELPGTKVLPAFLLLSRGWVPSLSACSWVPR